MRSHERMTLRHDDAVEMPSMPRKTMMGLSKDMRYSDSSRKAFVPKVRGISAGANWSISISVFRKRYWPPLREGC